MRAPERGAAIPAASGPGACPAAYAATRWGHASTGPADVLVHMDGGTARVSFDPDHPTRAVLTGPATFVGSIQVPSR
jgi:diaminopimelate epimerase